MKLIVIHNPDSGGGEWCEDRVERLLKDAGHAVRLVSTADKWQKALEEEPDAFVAAGGDGTVHKLIRALKGRTVPIAILPTGTANNVAHSLGYRTGEELSTRVRHWEANERLLQLGLVQRGGHQQCLIEAVGLGAFTQMVSESGGGKKRSSVGIALLAIRRKLVEILLEAEPIRITIRIDGRRATTGEFLMLECVNLSYYGPRLRLAPNEGPDTGTVTLWGVRPEARQVAAEWLSTGEPVDDLILGQGSHVEIAARETAHLDGSPWPSDDDDDGLLRVTAGVRGIRMWV